MAQTIAIIDYDSGNIHSVQKALEFVAPNDTIIHTSDKVIINDADKVIFPGQGAMGNCMQKLAEYDLIKTIKNNAKSKPFLGICLGLQLLFDKSKEDNCNGLGVIAGDVVRFNSSLKVPHIGWNKVEQTQGHKLWHNIDNNSYFYSVHSYFVQPKNQNIIIGKSDYSVSFTTVIMQNNLIAVQFHPEKSDKNGLRFLKNFIQLNNN